MADDGAGAAGEAAVGDPRQRTVNAVRDRVFASSGWARVSG
jgi:hypothetical protein